MLNNVKVRMDTFVAVLDQFEREDDEEEALLVNEFESNYGSWDRVNDYKAVPANVKYEEMVRSNKRINRLQAEFEDCQEQKQNNIASLAGWFQERQNMEDDMDYVENQVCTVCPQLLFALNCLSSTVCPQLFALS